jgi:hypothetical protein
MLGALLCSNADIGHKCLQREGDTLFWYGHNWSYPPTKFVINILEHLMRIHRYFNINKLGLIVVGLFSIAMGLATYWLIVKIVQLLRHQKQPNKS